jgi:AraC-like DNA-binding protein/quercetin dioxygenase-like cupin family protein
MSKSRHRSVFDPRRSGTATVTTLSYEYRSGHAVPEHFHEQDQLLYAVRGVMTVRTARGLWVVPPSRAVWVPARRPHSIAMSGPVTMKTLYLTPRVVRKLPRDCCVLNVGPLLRELVLHACTFEALDAKVPAQGRIIGILLDQLAVAPTVPLQLPSPRDPRAMRVAQLLVDDPGDGRSVEELCAIAGASRRTIERAFQLETKLTFGRWRQQARLLHAIRSLASGDDVTHAALAAGYGTPSAFIAMFRRALGTTPGDYFRDPR